MRKLETERTQRDEIEAKRARIADTLAFDTPGSRLDVFARARRGTIEAQLRRFGLAGADVNSSYRSLARDIDPRGRRARRGRDRSIWANGSQSRLILWAIVAFVLGFLIRLLHSDAAVAAVGDANDWLKPVAGWIAAHGDWFDRASEILYLLGALAIALNLWRALQFFNLLLRGSRLLTSEVRERRQDLEARAARLNQRVATLTAESEAAARRAKRGANAPAARRPYAPPGRNFSIPAMRRRRRRANSSPRSA